MISILADANNLLSTYNTLLEKKLHLSKYISSFFFLQFKFFFVQRQQEKLMERTYSRSVIDKSINLTIQERKKKTRKRESLNISEDLTCVQFVQKWKSAV